MDLTAMPLTPEDRAAIQPVADRLSRLVPASTTSLVHNATYKPVGDSRIGRAKKSGFTDAYDQARQRLVSAEDHFRTMLNLLIGPAPLPSFSLFTLIRGGAVATVHARYLLDPAIDETVRLGRGLSARLENLKQQQKLISELDPPERPPQPFATWDDWLADRVTNLESRANANGVAVGRTKKGTGSLKGFPDAWPYDTDLFEKYMPGIGKTYFKSLSGYTHSMPWTTITMQRAQPSDEPGIALVPTDVNVTTLAVVLDSALEIYDETVGSFLNHGGYPAMVWKETKKPS
jgi:hypothetical protein